MHYLDGPLSQVTNTKPEWWLITLINVPSNLKWLRRKSHGHTLSLERELISSPLFPKLFLFQKHCFSPLWGWGALTHTYLEMQATLMMSMLCSASSAIAKDKGWTSQVDETERFLSSSSVLGNKPSKCQSLWVKRSQKLLKDLSINQSVKKCQVGMAYTSVKWLSLWGQSGLQNEF